LRVAMGVDLAGSSARPTGICFIDEELIAETSIVYEDREILDLALSRKPDVIAIDAPLSLPKAGRFRECDRKLLRRGIKLFPPTLGPMRKLTLRGIALKEILEKRGFTVIEVFPGGAQDILGIPRKSKGVSRLAESLRALGIKNIPPRASPDELDAVTAAYVGILYLAGEVEIVSGRDGEIVMPRKTKEADR